MKKELLNRRIKYSLFLKRRIGFYELIIIYRKLALLISFQLKLGYIPKKVDDLFPFFYLK